MTDRGQREQQRESGAWGEAVRVEGAGEGGGRREEDGTKPGEKERERRRKKGGRNNCEV